VTLIAAPKHHDYKRRYADAANTYADGVIAMLFEVAVKDVPDLCRMSGIALAIRSDLTRPFTMAEGNSVGDVRIERIYKYLGREKAMFAQGWLNDRMEGGL
jgi:hypothetical protein